MGSYLSWVCRVLTIASLVLVGGGAVGQAAGPDKVRLNADYRLSGPYAYRNLEVFFIHGKADMGSKRYIPLSEALEKGVVVIDETGDVNHLSATNHSDKDYVFIQSGDMVKGGRQDRTLSQDVVLPPKSGKIALDAFCVEHGRWSRRGKEKSDRFSSADKGLSSKRLKLAAKQAKSQQAVWEAVAAEQERLGRSVGKSVRKPASDTSMQLSLEDEEVEKQVQAYKQVLLPLGLREKDAVGFAYTINGRFNSADIYGDPGLFRRLWPKLIASAACEAVSMRQGKDVRATARPVDIKRHIVDAINSLKHPAPSGRSTRRLAGETGKSYTYETKDRENQTIHLNIIAK
jgi:hypothetical protein